ncbi:MAG: OB-fold nucleic acid binding domain-containing protein, partial [Bacilli bacterium]
MSKIKEFKEGSLIKGKYLVSNVTKGKASNGKDYLNIKLQDDSGEIDAKLWSASPVQMEQITNGKILQIDANVIKY